MDTAFRREYAQQPSSPQPMCPHCGALPGVDERGLIADHDEPERPNLCPGSYQVPRNHESDRRRLWNGKPNPHTD